MIQKPKGTYDVFDLKSKQIIYIASLLNEVMKKYNYEYVKTPLFESSELFHRGVGPTSDIVTKETYDFVDRGGRSLTLRPEGTASIVRMLIENKLYGNATLPLKYWYFGPMYRYERPQSGRFREFYQFGLEVFGCQDAIIDSEVISIAYNIYRLMGLKDIKVHLNSLGNLESRNRYKQALIDYFKPHLDTLCDDCKTRFLKNPLRILDCKVDSSKDIFKKAPVILDYLDLESKTHFEKVISYLDMMDINYVIDSKVVRGLDYYNHTVFEIEDASMGKNAVLCGGGRYDNLVSSLGGPNLSGVGYAFGLERLLDVLENHHITLYLDDGIDIYIAPMSDSETKYALSLANTLRLNGFKVDIDYMQRNLKANFKQADRLMAKYIIILGSNEVETQVLTVKDNKSKEEYKVKSDDLISFLCAKIESSE